MPAQPILAVPSVLPNPGIHGAQLAVKKISPVISNNFETTEPPPGNDGLQTTNVYAVAANREGCIDAHRH